MNGIHRIALAIAGLATVTAVGGVFAAQGYVEAQQQAQAAESARSRRQAAAEAAARTLPPLSTQVVYVNPGPTPQVDQRRPDGRSRPGRRPSSTSWSRPPGGEDEDEHEEDDD